MSDEVSFYEWLKKISERLSVINFNIHNGHDIIDDDWDVIRAMIPLWYNETVTFEQMLHPISQPVIQGRLFDDNISGGEDGMDVEVKAEEP